MKADKTFYLVILAALTALVVLAVTGLMISGRSQQSQKSPLSLTEDQATELIKALPEVQDYIQRLAQSGVAASFNIEDRGEEWVVQVYEVVQQGGGSHTATFSWYRVDKQTGDIAKEFE